MALKHVPIDCECILIPATARTIKMTLQACLGREESIYPTCKLLQIELRYFKVDLLKVPGPEQTFRTRSDQAFFVTIGRFGVAG
jgi:hypothetical protein